MPKYQWKRGVVQETLPSSLNWWTSLILLFGIYYLLLNIILVSDALYIYKRVAEKAYLFWGVGIWFFFRTSLTAFRITTAVEYLAFSFPRMRRELETFPPYSTIAILYTGYAKSDVEVFNALTAVYKAAFRYGATKTILVLAMSKNEKGEREFPLLEEIRRYMINLAESEEEAGFYKGMVVRAFAQDGTGKRSALVKAIRFVRKIGGADAYYMMDGDSIPQEDAFVRAIPFLQNYPDIGAVTLENYSYTQGGGFYNLYSLLRFMRRRVDLAYAATVLTGRGSFIRGNILEQEQSLLLLDAHFIQWRGKEGIIRALTGDDKTMVYLTWSQGYKTIFVPDVALYAMEEPLEEAGAKVVVRGLQKLGMHEYFAPFLSMLVQETRYTRNMQLVGKALWDVRPADLATTLKLLDQRFFFWAALVGPLSAIVASIAYHPVVFFFWVFTSLTIRVVVTLFQGILYGYWHPMMPVVSFFNIIQSVVKIFSYWNIGRARWSRDGGNLVGAYNWFTPSMHIAIILIILYMLLK